MEWGGISVDADEDTSNTSVEDYEVLVTESSLLEPDLEIILSILGTWASNKIPTVKLGSEYWRRKIRLRQWGSSIINNIDYVSSAGAHTLLGPKD